MSKKVAILIIALYIGFVQGVLASGLSYGIPGGDAIFGKWFFILPVVESVIFTVAVPDMHQTGKYLPIYALFYAIVAFMGYIVGFYLMALNFAS